MKKTKKILAICLALSLFVSMFTVLGTVTVSAVGTEASGRRDLDWDGTYWYSDTKVSTYTAGSGTADDPYIITTAAELRHLARGNGSGGGKYYKLGCDIVINDTSAEDWYEGTGLKNWIKGTDSTYGTFSDARNIRELGGDLFRDTFDGDGHTISGLYINYSGTGTMSGSNSSRIHPGWGLFPYVMGATFKNVKLKDVYIKSNITASNTADYHGYGALVGNVYGDNQTTFQNVEVQNVQFDIARPGLTAAGKPVGIGGIIGYSLGNITVTDAIVRNVTAKISNWYATSRCSVYVGGIVGAMGWGKTATLTNVLTIGKMNPFSASSASSGGAVTITSGNWIQDIKTNQSINVAATNCYSIGAEKIITGAAITLVADESTFISDYLDTFYANIGASTNWADKSAGTLPSLNDFPYVEEHKIPGAAVRCNFSDYAPGTGGKALDNWSIVDTDGNKSLMGDFTNDSLAANNFGFIVGSYNYGVHGPLVPGKIYRLQFKAKATQEANMDYALFNGSTYACSSRDSHVVDSGYDSFGRRTAQLTTEWQEFSTYFTFESYTNTVDPYQGVNRPYFFIFPKAAIWENVLYFDDMVITPYDGMSFREEENHYFEPTIGNIGDDVTFGDDYKLEGYAFEGWYTDPEYNTAFDPDTVKIGDVPVLYGKWEECMHANEIIVPAIDSTCATPGHDEYTICADCGYLLDGDDTPWSLDSENHEGEGTEIRDAKAATCTEAGYTGDTYCLGCGAKLSEGEQIEALSHDFGEYVSDNNATCTADGTKTAHCSRCDATDTVSDVGSMLAHNVGEWIFDETTHHRHCADCDQDVDAGEHAFEWVITKEATAEENGLREEICSVCGYKSGNSEEIVYSAHKPGDINNDGAVNNKDLTRLFQYLSDWDVQVNAVALDVNGDGNVNNKDLTRLFQYLSDWEVEIF